MKKHSGRNWEKKEGCKCPKCLEVEVNVEVEVEVELEVDCKENHKKHDHDEKKCECKKCEGKTDKVEFKSDISFADDEIKKRPIEVLQVTFDKICENDKVWFSGIVGFDNDDNNPVTIKLTIVRTQNGNDKTIYRQTFEIDKEDHDDITQVPFAHVEYEQSEAKDVTYTVFVERLDNNGEVFLFGQSTLAALRIN